MIGTIRKHQSWLWAIIITVTIGSFVVFGPTNTKLGGNALSSIFGGPKAELGILGGQPITREAFSRCRNEVLLDGFLKTQQPANPNSVDVIRETYWRLMIIQKQKELGIQPSPEAITAFGRRFIPASAGALDQFDKNILKPLGLDLTDLENFLRHQSGMEQLIIVAGASGKMVTPGEAETMYRLENRDLESSIVYFSASNYLSSVTVSPELVAEFYTNQLANYRVPDQVKVNYVTFPASNYTAQAIATLTNLDKIVDANVDHLGTNFYHGTKSAAESREAIKKDIVNKAALELARKVAGVFAEDLDQAQPHSLATFAKLAASTNLPVKTTEPFDREYGPQDLKLPPGFTSKAFTLAPDDLYGGPIKGDDAVYVIALVERLPSRTPALKEIETKVTSDFRYASAFQLAQQTAIKFSTTVSNGLAAGKSFTAVCAVAGLHSVSLPPFSLSSTRLTEEVEDRISFRDLKQIAFMTSPGKASPPANARDGAFILYVDKLLPVDEARMKTEMPAYLAHVREVRQNDAFQQWFYSQLKQDPEFFQYVMGLQDSQMKSSTARRPKS